MQPGSKIEIPEDAILVIAMRNGKPITSTVLRWPNLDDGYTPEMFYSILDSAVSSIEEEARRVSSDEGA